MAARGKFKIIYIKIMSFLPCPVKFVIKASFQTIDLMHDDVTHPEREYGRGSHTQIQDGRQ